MAIVSDASDRPQAGLGSCLGLQNGLVFARFPHRQLAAQPGQAAQCADLVEAK